MLQHHRKITLRSLLLVFLLLLFSSPVFASDITITIDRSEFNNGGTFTVTGKAPAGSKVFLEVWSEKRVRASYFDCKKDPKTGKIPYVLCLCDQIPAFYHLVIPTTEKNELQAIKAQGNKWSLSQALKDLGAEAAYQVPAQAEIKAYKASFLASVIGSRGELLPPLNSKEARKRSMQLVKARFRDPNKIFSPTLEINPDGSFKATVTLPKNSAPGQYSVVAVTDKGERSQPVHLENSLHFPTIYLGNAGTGINILGPFLLALAITTFGVLMGAGGGFILNPLLVSLWPLPHTIVAGTVMPTVLFSQASGIYNYSRIKFINWKLGLTLGAAMVLGGFIGPKLTELITLDQFKFVFGWILLVLAGLMVWQTTPGYLQRHKKEQAILKEFRRRAQEAAKARLAGEANK
ncbi:TSUP family transporter [Desulfothermobacter acidiphilus]|uniref:TSUP family transporter n=1 Tax=Desulfothermobacter acidiphilus TaxID=1938353 RepID=UPI003F88CDD4